MTGVAATDDWLDPDLVRQPAGEVHAWQRGHNSTVCGLHLSRSRRCAAAMPGRAGRRARGWTREHPRP